MSDFSESSSSSSSDSEAGDPRQPLHLQNFFFVPAGPPSVARLLNGFELHTDNYVSHTWQFLSAGLELLERLKASPRLQAELGLENPTMTAFLEVHERMAACIQSFSDVLQEEKKLLRQLTELVQPSSLASLQKKWMPVILAAPKVAVDRAVQSACIVCTESTANAVIRRRCTADASRTTRCEAKECNCGPVVCATCLLHHFWVQSEKGLRSYARCPHCRAEFCPSDITEVTFSEKEEKETPRLGRSRKRRAGQAPVPPAAAAPAERAPAPAPAPLPESRAARPAKRTRRATGAK